MSKRSVNNFAKKLGASPILPNHLVRSTRTQESIENSTKFYRENIEKQQVLLEQQLSYREREAERPEVELPSNIITLRNGSRWVFDSKKNKFINIDTLEELSVQEYHKYSTLVALGDAIYDYDSGSSGFSICNITLSPPVPSADGTETIVPTVVMCGGVSATLSFKWSYTGAVNPNITT